MTEVLAYLNGATSFDKSSPMTLFISMIGNFGVNSGGLYPCLDGPIAVCELTWFFFVFILYIAKRC